MKDNDHRTKPRARTTGTHGGGTGPSLDTLDSLVGRKKGGRGQCPHCGEWHNNVAYHAAHECAANA